MTGDPKFFRLLESIPAAAYTCDTAGLISYFNRGAVELWGREPNLNDPVDRFCGSFKLFAPDGSPINHDRCWMAQALRDCKDYNGHEIIIGRPDGSRRRVLAYANPFYDEHGRISGAVNILVDVTERKRDEELLRQADRQKSEFLATLAHELRNPLAPIRNALQVMRLASHDRDLLDEARTVMDRQIRQMVRLIDDLLDLSRVSRGKVQLRTERLDLATAVQDAIETSRPWIEESAHKLGVRLPSQAIYVDGDRTRLAQVFSNLLNNSCKYMERGGHITLSLERQGNDAIITIKDQGIGIPADMLPKIFDMFTQVDRSLERSQGGLGIGLTLVRALVEMHGGRVEAQSNGLGAGSEFTVHLPVLSSLPPEQDDVDSWVDRNGCQCQLRIVIVDDNQDSAQSLAMMLRIMGHETWVAHDGVAGVQTAERRRPDVLLMDIGLPRLNGYDACRRIRSEPWGKDMVIIALSGWGQEEDRRRSKSAGFNFHMVKPVDPAALEKLLAGLLLSPT
jgi:PAS domain S-box-containing protein